MKAKKIDVRCDACLEAEANKVDRYGRRLCKPCFDDSQFEREEMAGD